LWVFKLYEEIISRKIATTRAPDMIENAREAVLRG
jgi:hypothetical protein